MRNVANYSPPVLAPDPDVPAEWETLLRLTGVVAGQGADADSPRIDRFVALETARRRRPPTRTRRSTAAIPRSCWPRSSRASAPSGCSTCCCAGGPVRARRSPTLEAAPHGIDLGPLEPRLPEVLRTPSGRIELAPEALVADVARLRAALAEPATARMVLVGRRDLRSNNSWMHNLPLLVSGKQRCTAHVHPDDAARLGLADGEPAVVRSRAGAVVVPVEVTDDVMPGVVSIPHGWGHDSRGAELAVAGRARRGELQRARRRAGARAAVGHGVLNGIPVELAPV